MAERVFQRLHPGVTGGGGSSGRGTGRDRHNPRGLSTGDTAALLESQRIMVGAWAKSNRDPRAAFTATGHLMRMHKLANARAAGIGGLLGHRHGPQSEDDAVEGIQGFYGGEGDEIEGSFDSVPGPTLDDYRVVMEAWTRAEYVRVLP
jgi:hypothetical protein